MSIVIPNTVNFDALDAAEKITGFAAKHCKNPEKAEKLKKANDKLSAINEKRIRLPQIIIF